MSPRRCHPQVACRPGAAEQGAAAAAAATAAAGAAAAAPRLALSLPPRWWRPSPRVGASSTGWLLLPRQRLPVVVRGHAAFPGSSFTAAPTPPCHWPPAAAELAEALKAGKLPQEILERFLDMDKNPMLSWLMKIG